MCPYVPNTRELATRYCYDEFGEDEEFDRYQRQFFRYYGLYKSRKDHYFHFVPRFLRADFTEADLKAPGDAAKGRRNKRGRKPSARESPRASSEESKEGEPNDESRGGGEHEESKGGAETDDRNFDDRGMDPNSMASEPFFAVSQEIFRREYKIQPLMFGWFKSYLQTKK